MKLMSDGNGRYRLKGRIWIEIGDKTLLGEGKAILLKKTSELGSLRKAAMELKMSYRQAWYHINMLNKATGTPLILLRRGGKDGGTAHITEFGEEIIGVFEKLQFEFREFLDDQTRILNSGK
jgi:molybdate transport system regulatory protein